MRAQTIEQAVVEMMRMFKQQAGDQVCPYSTQGWMDCRLGNWAIPHSSPWSHRYLSSNRPHDGSQELLRPFHVVCPLTLTIVAVVVVDDDMVVIVYLVQKEA